MPKGSTPKPDAWNVNADGTLTLTIDGKDHILRRPKHGEQRRFDEALLKIQMLERAQNERESEAFKGSLAEVAKLQGPDAGAAVESIPPERLARVIEQAARINPEEAAKYRYEIEDARIAWWAEQVIPILCADPPDLELDTLPNFLAVSVIINAARRGWSGNPSGPGGP